MNRDDTCDLTAGSARNWLSRLRVDRTTRLQIFTELVWIHGVGPGVDVDEFRQCACLGNCLRGSDKRMRNGQDTVASGNPGGDQAKTQCIRAASYSNAAVALAEAGKGLFKILNGRTANK